jgi:hypothetical protein
MSELLVLASDYIEHMANPQYGTAVNEDYANRFAVLLQSKEFEAQLDKEIEELEDRGTLSSHGWLWLLERAKSRKLRLREKLLLELFQHWPNVFIRSDIVDVATQSAEPPVSNLVTYSLSEFPNRFLRQILTLATRSSLENADRDSPLSDEKPGVTTAESSGAFAESTLFALLQVGRPLTLDAATVLLKHRWPGQERLLESFRAVYNSLERETQRVWVQRLDPPTIVEREM